MTLEAAVEGGSPKVDIKAYTGGKLALRNFPHPVVIKASGVKAMDAEQQPLLRDHDQGRAVGHGRPVIEANQLSVEGSLSIAGDDRDAITAASKEGFKWQASVGGRIPNTRKDVKTIAAGNSVTVNGRTHVGPLHVVNAFLWKETSIVALGADEGRASANIAANDSSVQRKTPMNEFEKWLEASGIDSDELSATAISELKAAHDALTAKGDNSPPVSVNVAEITAAAAQAAIEASRTEAQRHLKIDRLFASYGDTSLTKEEVDQLRAQAESGELGETEVHLRLLQASRAQQTSNVAAGGNNMSNDVMAIEAAVAINGGLTEDDVRASFIDAGATDEQADRALNDASKHRSASIKTIIAAACHQAGHSFFGTVGDEEIRAALEHARDFDRRGSSSVRAASGFSTISLPGILSRLANKAMLAAYAEADNGGVATTIASVTSTNDFKKFTRYRMTESGVMEEVPAGGEIKHGMLIEEEYENQVKTYGKILALTRQMMRNDDLDAFLQIPRLIGRQGRHALEQHTITTLVDAPTAAGAGTTEFFHGALRGNQEPNYLEGASTALAIDSLELAYELFLNQVDADGKPIMIDPGLLLVPTSEAVMARKLYNDVEYRFTGTDLKETVNNQWKGMFRPVVSSYLHRMGAAPSSAAWYLLSNPTTDVSGLQIAFLDGNRTPTLDRAQTDFNTLGVQWRGYYDFGIALQDPRAIVKVKGEA